VTFAGLWRFLRGPSRQEVAADKRRLEQVLRSHGVSKAVATRIVFGYFVGRK